MAVCVCRINARKIFIYFSFHDADSSPLANFCSSHVITFSKQRVVQSKVM